MVRNAVHLFEHDDMRHGVSNTREHAHPAQDRAILEFELKLCAVGQLVRKRTCQTALKGLVDQHVAHVKPKECGQTLWGLVSNRK